MKDKFPCSKCSSDKSSTSRRVNVLQSPSYSMPHTQSLCDGLGCPTNSTWLTQKYQICCQLKVCIYLFYMYYMPGQDWSTHKLSNAWSKFWDWLINIRLRFYREWRPTRICNWRSPTFLCGILSIGPGCPDIIACQLYNVCSEVHPSIFKGIE